jgi:hypothetical protein
MVDQYAALYKNMLHGRAKHVPGPRRPMIAHLGPPPSEQGGMVTSIRLLSEASASSAVRTILLSNAASKSSTPGWALLNHTAALWRLATTLLTRPVVLLHIHTCSGFTFYRNMVDSWHCAIVGDWRDLAHSWGKVCCILQRDWRLAALGRAHSAT